MGVYAAFWREMVILKRRVLKTPASNAVSPMLFSLPSAGEWEGMESRMIYKSENLPVIYTLFEILRGENKQGIRLLSGFMRILISPISLRRLGLFCVSIRKRMKRF